MTAARGKVKTGISHLSGLGPGLRAERLIFGKTGWSVDFHGCTGIVAGLSQVLRGWQLSTGLVAGEAPRSLRAIIRRHENGWDWQAFGAPKAREWDAKPPRTEMRVITDVHDAAVYWYLAENPQLLCMHGASVQIGGGLVCFPARFRAGKSTLMACLAARGHKVFGDDVLGLDGRIGMALGFLPRLRVPLAPTLTAANQRYINDHRGPANESWIYLDPGARAMASHGEIAPISHFVLLDRVDGGKPKATPARTADVLKMLIAENIVRQLPMPEIFDRLHDLAVSSKRIALTYSDPQQAARLLEKLAS